MTFSVQKKIFLKFQNVSSNFFCLGLLLGILNSCQNTQKSEVSPIDTQKTFQFIKNQLVPNSSLQNIPKNKLNLVQSYYNAKGPLMDRISFNRIMYSYDLALSLIAAVIGYDLPLVKKLLFSTLALLKHTPEPAFSYSLEDPTWPQDKPATFRSGSSAWVLYALAFAQIELSQEKIPWFDEKLKKTLLDRARTLLQILLKRQVLKKSDPRFGLIKGGRNILMDQVDPQSKKLKTIFRPEALEWASTEHNIDFYFALTAYTRAFQPSDKLLLGQRIKLLQKGLLAIYDEKNSQFMRGAFLQVDPLLVLDCASWGSILLLNLDQKKARLAFEQTQKYRTQHGPVWGFRPQINGWIYESYDLNHLVLKDSSVKRWEDLPFIWNEGSAGVGLAALKMAEEKVARQIYFEIQKWLDPVSGGIKYANFEIPNLFSDQPALASSVWFYILGESLQGNPRALRFMTEANSKF